MKFERKGKFNSVSDFVKSNVGNLERFTTPIENPYINGLAEGAACIKANKDKKFMIVGDYDVDGMCSTFILSDGMERFLGVRPHFRIPHRFNEGYGLNISIIEEAREYFDGQPGVLITCDNGIGAYEEIKKAKEYGITVILTDHHLAPVDDNGEQIIPPADVVIDPHTDDSHYIHYCGAGIAYRLIRELLGKDIESLMVVAGLATVCDMVPLIGANRYLVKESLRLFRNGKAPVGLQELCNEMGIPFLYEDDYAFKLGPALNCLTRLTPLKRNDADIAIRLLYSDRAGAKPIVEWMVKRNQTRKDITTNCTEYVKSSCKITRPLVCYHEKFHPGIIGILAGDFCATLYCPTIFFTKTKDGILHGSARSIDGFHIRKIFDGCSDLLLGYGGHELAAGLSLEEKNLEEFTARFQKLCSGLPLIPDGGWYDIEAEANQIKSMKEELDKYAPYGMGNPKPYISLHLPEYQYSYMGLEKQHIRIVQDDFTVCGFNLADSFDEEHPTHLVGRLSDNWFRGNHSTQMILNGFF